MSAESALYALLSASSGLAALVGARIYPLAIPEEQDLPAVAYALTGQTPQRAIGQPPRLWRSAFTLDAWAKSYPAAKALGEAARQALEHQSGTHGGTEVLSCLVDSQSDAYDAEAKAYQVTLDVTLTHT